MLLTQNPLKQSHEWISGPRIQIKFLAVCMMLLVACKSEQEFQEATSAELRTYYDYIIVGGGAAGCGLAATLSTQFKVLLLERGGSPYGNPNLTRRDNFQLSDVGEDGALQAFVSTEGVRALRARVLGGGTSVNAGIYSRASALDVERMGLDAEMVESSFRWVESFLPSLLPPDKYQAALRSSMLEAGIKPDGGATYEHLVGTKTTGTLFDSQGYRHPASDLLKLGNESNLQVLLHATVQRVVFQGKNLQQNLKQYAHAGNRATGVLYTDSSGQNHTARLDLKCQCEVIVSAGALGSPQLLLLSGVGPKEHLLEMNIGVVLDSPSVGQQMADNPEVLINIPSPINVGTSLGQAVGITSYGVYFTGASVRGGGSVYAEVSGPASKGSMRLKTLNAKDNPDITFNYFRNPEDLKKCISGLNTAEEMVLSAAFTDYRFRNQTLPSGGNRNNSSRANAIFAKYCKENVKTAYHFHGGCLVGKVLDSHYRVLGVEGLRVVDGSTLEFSPGTNPCATLLMLGRYTGLRILADQMGLTKPCNQTFVARE